MICSNNHNKSLQYVAVQWIGWAAESADRGGGWGLQAAFLGCRRPSVPAKMIQAQLNQTLKWGTGLSSCSTCYRELFKSSVRSESLFFCKSVKYMDEIAIDMPTHMQITDEAT